MKRIINRIRNSEAAGLVFTVSLVAVPMIVAGLQWRWIPFFFGWPVPMPWPVDPVSTSGF